MHRPFPVMPVRTKHRFRTADIRTASSNDELLTRGGNINLFRTDGDISAATDERIVLCEYMEKHPIVLGNVGMASRIVTYKGTAFR